MLAWDRSGRPPLGFVLECDIFWQMCDNEILFRWYKLSAGGKSDILTTVISQPVAGTCNVYSPHEDALIADKSTALPSSTLQARVSVLC